MDFCGHVCNPEPDAVESPNSETVWEKVLSILDKLKRINRRHSTVRHLWNLRKYYISGFTYHQLHLLIDLLDINHERFTEISEEIKKLSELTGGTDLVKICSQVNGIVEKVDLYEKTMLPFMWIIGGPAESIEWDSDVASDKEEEDLRVPTVWPENPENASDYSTDASEEDSSEEEEVVFEE